MLITIETPRFTTKEEDYAQVTHKVIIIITQIIYSSICLQGYGQHIYNDNKVNTATISGPYNTMTYKTSSTTLT